MTRNQRHNILLKIMFCLPSVLNVLIITIFKYKNFKKSIKYYETECVLYTIYLFIS